MAVLPSAPGRPVISTTHCSIEPTTGQAYSFEVTVLPKLEFSPGRDTFVFTVIVDGTEFDNGMIDKENVYEAEWSDYITCRRAPVPDVFLHVLMENASDEKFEADMARIGDMGVIKIVLGFATKLENDGP
ncbi:hypothetical protein DER46DRAFT_578838 [Fusarium sp. MPI-SDFR-AT-0072]|nr:hypothetical protein DER46DRAFT_578838 [Fusarium sp. MPI-SDFR-AT-0072]